MTGRTAEARFFRFVAAHPERFASLPLNKVLALERQRAARGHELHVDGKLLTIKGEDFYAFSPGRQRVTNWHRKQLEHPKARQVIQKLGAVERRGYRLDTLACFALAYYMFVKKLWVPKALRGHA